MRLTIDASVYVSLLNDSEIHHLTSVAFFERISKSGVRVFNPEICIAEVISAKVRQRSSIPQVARSREFLLKQPHAQFYPITRQVTESALQIIEQFRLRSADALYFAIAQIQKCDAVVTWDKEMLNLSHLAKAPDTFGEL